MKLIIDKTQNKFIESADYGFLTTRGVKFISFISFISIYKR